MGVPLHDPTAPRLVIDVETYSTVDLAKAGAHAYAEHPDTGVHCVAWKIKGGFSPGKGLWVPGQPVPPSVAEHIKARGLIVAHNYLFELVICYRVLQFQHLWPTPALRQFSCTMARALYHGLPASLELLGEAMNLTAVKDKTARANMLKLAKPRGEDAQGRPTWWKDDPDKGPAMLQNLYDYCQQDVETESEADDNLPELPDVELEHFRMDGAINLCGIRIDDALIDALQIITDDETRRLNQDMETVTGGAVRSINQTKALTAWLQAEGMTNLTTLAKGGLDDAVEDAPTPAARQALLLRQEGAKASTAKLRSMKLAASRDRRARGLLQFYGAGRTGRWAGRRVQPQNMTRPSVKTAEIMDAIRFALGGHQADVFRMLFSKSPMEIVSNCLRSCLVAEKGYMLGSVDLSQIEARIIAWLAGQADILAVFARREDVYTYTAAKVGSTVRQLGKVLVLACGFGMGWSKFQETARTYGLELSAEDAQEFVYEWREANQAIVSFWYALDALFRRIAISPSGTWERLGVLQVGKTGKAVRIRLPSRRDLVYQHVELQPNPETARDEITYMGVHQTTKKWERLRTYGGKLAENVTQAVARDVMAHALGILHRSLRWPARIVGSIHDEGLFETPEGMAQVALDHALRVFKTPPAWAPGLPVDAEGWIGPRYRK